MTTWTVALSQSNLKHGFKHWAVPHSGCVCHSLPPGQPHPVSSELTFSILCPLFYILHTTNISHVLSSLGATAHQYACIWFTLKPSETCTCSEWAQVFRTPLVRIQETLSISSCLINDKVHKLTRWTQSLSSRSPMHLSKEFGVSTSMKFRAFRTLFRRLSSNFPARNFSMSRKTVKPRSWRWTLSKLHEKKPTELIK